MCVKIQKVVNLRRLRRSRRVASAIRNGRLRLSLCVSGKHVYAQVIDDVNSRTVAFANSCEKLFTVDSVRSNVLGATAVGRLIGERAVSAGVTEVAFDRGCRRYHGVVSAFADAVRAAGVQF